MTRPLGPILLAASFLVMGAFVAYQAAGILWAIRLELRGRKARKLTSTRRK